MNPVTALIRTDDIAIVYQHDPAWIILTLDKGQQDQAEKLIDFWNNSPQDNWEIYTLDIKDIIEVCLDNDLPIPAQEDIYVIVHQYEKVCQGLMEDWQTYLAEIIEGL